MRRSRRRLRVVVRPYRVQWRQRQVVEFGGIAAVVLTSPLWASNYVLHILITIWLFSIASLGARLLLLQGVWSFGQGAFLTIGAYTCALGAVRGGLAFWLVVPLSVLVTAGVAAVVGRVGLRAGGVYFAIFSMILVFIVTQIIIATPDTTGGQAGLQISIAPFDRIGMYVLASGMFLICLGVMMRVDQSRLARVQEATRQNESLARSIGIRVIDYKVRSFLLAGAFAGLAGAFSAAYFSVAHPEVWGFWPSIFIVSYAIIGGVRSVYGPILGAAGGIVAVELLAATHEMQTVLLGAGLIVVMLVLPEGLVGLPRSLMRAIATYRSRERGYPARREKSSGVL